MERIMKSNDDLIKACEHVKYEFDMLLCTNNALQSEMAKDPMIKNALLESFLMHFRNLYDFFIEQPQKDDILAKHWFGVSGQWDPKIDNLKGYKQKVNKRLAHLTYDRLGNTHEWDYQKLADAIKTQMTDFLNNVADEKLDDGLKSLKKELCDPSKNGDLNPQVANNIRTTTGIFSNVVKYIRKL